MLNAKYLNELALIRMILVILLVSFTPLLSITVGGKWHVAWRLVIPTDGLTLYHLVLCW